MQLDSRHLPSDRGLILVAFSGGPDSTALLHLIHADGYAVHVAHVHHGLRGEEADGDARYCAQFCQERSIPFTLISVDVRGEREDSGGGVQEVARRLRYAALERCASEVGASVIATGHNSDDNAETILLNILRGAGTDGLRGIPERRVNIVRPLLRVSRAEIEAYCVEHGLMPRRDSSNDSTKYSRNEVRHELMPYLRGRFNPRVQDALIRLSLVASDESDYLNAEAGRWLSSHPQFSNAELSDLPPALQRRVLRSWLRETRGLKNVSFDYIEQLRDISSETDAAIGSHSELLSASREMKAPWQDWDGVSRSIDVPGSAEFFGWRAEAIGCLPHDIEHVIVRFWKYGDRIYFPFGRRKLSDLFGEAKWSVVQRYRTPLLVEAESQKVLAVANWRVSPLAPDLRFTAEQIEPTSG